MTLTIAVVGLGVGEQHARAFAARRDCRVKWLHDLNGAKAQTLARDLGQGTAAENFAQILADPDVDAVSLATYDDHHYQAVCQALDAGKHVFVEKPLCRTEAELDDIRDRWVRTPNLHLRSNLVLRHAQAYVWLKNAIAGGEFGQVYAFDGEYLYGRLEKITEGWRNNVADYSVMEGGGIHLIDLMLWFLEETPSTVTTEGTRIATRGTAFRHDDFMAATFTFPSGVIGRITANFGCVHPHHHIVRVFGTKATFIYDDQGPRLFRNRIDGGTAEKLNLTALPEGKHVLIPGFAEAVLAGQDPGPAAQREFNLINACAAADQAHRNAAKQDVRAFE